MCSFEVFGRYDMVVEGECLDCLNGEEDGVVRGRDL